MKILYISSSLAVWGGIERILVDKMNHLVSMYDYDVSMLTTDQGEHSVPYKLSERVHLEDLDINFHHQYRYKGLRRLWDAHRRTIKFEERLSERLKQIRPDLIICTTSEPVHTIEKISGKIPLIVESHSICSRTMKKKGVRQHYIAYLMKKGLRRANCLVTLTEGDANEWKSICNHIRVIPNVVHLNDGEISTLDNKRVIFVGRFDYQKRQMEIIKIWQSVYPKHPDWRLDIYGDGEKRQEIEQAAKMLNMNIFVHKPTRNIFDCYRESSLLVLTSLFEPFGLVLPEAMSCGLPVIAYDSPYGPASIITNGSDGFLVANNDRETFADRMNLLMADHALRVQMGTKAAESSRRFSADRIMPIWNQLFEEVVNKQTK